MRAKKLILYSMEGLNFTLCALPLIYVHTLHNTMQYFLRNDPDNAVFSSSKAYTSKEKIFSHQKTIENSFFPTTVKK